MYGRKFMVESALQWNCLLVQELLPIVYRILLERLKKIKEKNPEEFYQAWPDVDLVEDRWQTVLDPLYNELLNQPMFYSKSGSGQWVFLNEAVLEKFTNYVLVQLTEEEIPGVQAAVTKIYNSCGEKLVQLPPHVYCTLDHLDLLQSVATICAERVRDILPASQQCLTRQDKLSVLRYLCCNDNPWTLVSNQELLPLANGSFTIFRFKNNISTPLLYWCRDDLQKLFPGLENEFCDTSVSDKLRNHLRDLALSGMFRLKTLEDSDAKIAELLHRSLQSRFGSQDPFFSEEDCWIRDVWDFLASREPWKHQLDALSDISLLPVTKDNGVQLLPLSGVYLCNNVKGMSPLSSVMESCLTKLGVTVLPALPDYITRHSCILGQIVQTPAIKGFKTVFERINDNPLKRKKAIQTFNESATKAEKEALLLEVVAMSGDCPADLLKKLKLFVEVRTQKAVAIDQVCFIAPDVCPPLMPLRPMLSPARVYKHAAVLLGATESTLNEIVNEVLCLMREGHVRFTEREIIDFAKFVLTNEELTADNALMKLFGKVKCIPSSHGQLKLASHLYDPKSNVLQKLFLQEDKFPSEEFSVYNILGKLKILGLKGEANVSDADVIQTAGLIENGIDQKEQKVAESKADELWNILKIHGCNFEDATMEALSTITCIPCESPDNVPIHYPGVLPYSSNARLVKPKHACLTSQACLVGSIFPVVKIENMVTANRLHIGSKVNVTNVLKHMKNILAHYSEAEASKCRLTLREIFVYLSRHIQNDRVIQTLMETECVITESGECWMPCQIWTCRERSDLDLKPYRIGLSADMQTVRNLFQKCGAFEHQDKKFLKMVLVEISQSYLQNTSEAGTDEKNKLKQYKVTQDIYLIKQILDKILLLENDPAVLKTIVLPLRQFDDFVLQFRQAKDCTVPPVDRLHEITSIEEDIFYVHPDIPRCTALAFGALKTKERQLTGIDWRGSLDFGYEQREVLTDRLHKLLKDSYTDGFSVPKELIQNADDAGATEVFFMLDERENLDARDNLISDNMDSLQGPAFWAFNNKPFTDKDFKNIIKLGAGTKKADAAKIGRYGLGFNSVYNLTDVPIFFSRHVLAFFDPHTKYLEKGAGLHVDFREKTNRTMLSKIPQQFKPFQGIFGCDLTNRDHVSYDHGVLFRFPLRTNEQAKHSLITKESYEKNKRKLFLKMLMEKAGSLLMFTQNVKNLKVVYLSSDATDPSCPKCFLDLHKSTASHLLKSEFQLGTQTIMQFYAQNWSKTRPDIKIIEDVTITITVKEEAVSFCGVEAHSSFTQWRIAWASGVQESAVKAHESLQTGLVPLASVAALIKDGAPVDIMSSPQGFYKSGHLYCFLPLPETKEQGQLPVHINATFALESSRRNLVLNTEDDLDISEEIAWNTALWDDAVSRAYILLLENVCIEATVAADFRSYFSLWPLSCQSMLVESFWRHLVNDGNDILPIPGNPIQWTSFTKAYILDHELRYGICGDFAWNALKHFWKWSGFFVDIPQDVYAAAASSKQGNKFKARILTVQFFYQEVLFPNIWHDYWVPSHRDALVLHALMLNKKELDILLQQFACIPTSHSIKLKKNKELLHPHGVAAKMYLPSDDCFPQGHMGNEGQVSRVNFCSEHSLTRLQELGILKDDLPWEMVLERARSVGILMNEKNDKAVHRAKSLLSYLSEYMDVHLRINTCPTDVKTKLSETEFLPTLKKPNGWPFTWAGQKQLATPREVYAEEMKNLVACHEIVVDCKTLGLSVSSYGNISVLEFLGAHFKKDPRNRELLNTVVKQIKTVASAKHKYSSTPDIAVDTICKDIYAYLSKCCENVSDISKILIQQLSNESIVWTGNCFVLPSEAVFKVQFDCKPYIFQVESSLHQYKSFLSKIGVKESVDTASIFKILHRVQREFQGRKLPEDIVGLVCHAAQLLHESKVPCDQMDTVYLPDRHGYMWQATQLCINDCEWLKETESMKIVSGRLPPETARVLGVKSKRGKDIESMGIGIPFGQKEKLTNRLKRLLQGYTFDSSMFMELIQNADDAGATQIMFIKDFRQLGTQYVLEGFEKLQGPALCVFNDKSFTTKDMEGIQNLGQASKAADALKIGQFGVGFNAVYNITDVPSFWTLEDDEREVLCIFDPNCKYLTNATPGNPGIKIEDMNRVRESYKDWFDGYLSAAVDMSKPGTLFRFPLRTQEMAKTSEIANEVVTEKRLTEVLNKFKDEMNNCMLFLTSIMRIGIYSVLPDGSLSKESEVSVDQDEDSLLQSNSFREKMAYAAECVSSQKINVFDIEHFEAIYCLTINKPGNINEQWLIVQAVGFKGTSSLSDSHQNEWQKGKLKLLPCGGVAVKLAETIGQEPMNIPKHVTNHQVFCMLPLPVHSKLPMHVNGHFVLDNETRRSLCKSEVQDFKTAWNKLIVIDILVPAYLTALQRITNMWFTNANMLDLAQLRLRLDYYNSLFPVLHQDNLWNDFQKNVYHQIKDQELPLFAVLFSSETCGIEMVPVFKTNGCAGYFFNPQHLQGCTPGTTQTMPVLHLKKADEVKAEKLIILLKQINMKVIEAPYAILTYFQTNSVEGLLEVTPQTVADFLKSSCGQKQGCCVIGNLPQPVAQTRLKSEENVKMLLEFLHSQQEILKDLESLPLCLRQSGNLSIFRSNLNEAEKPIASIYANLLPGSCDHFVSANIFTFFLPGNVGIGERETVPHTLLPWIKELDIATMVRLLPGTLPASLCTGNMCVYVEELFPSTGWLKTFWNFIRSQCCPNANKDRQVLQHNFKEKMKGFYSWNLLPVKMNGPERKKLLYPVKCLDNIVFLADKPDASHKDLWTAIKSFDLPFLNMVQLPQTCILPLMVASIKHPHALLTALKNGASTLHLGLQQAMLVLNYFNKNFENLLKECKEGDVLFQTLKCLPLYITIDGKATNISPFMTPLCLDSSIPAGGLETWTRNLGDIFLLLKESSVPRDMCAHLKIETPSPSEFYCRYLLPNFRALPTDFILEHLTTIKNEMSEWPKHDLDKIKKYLQNLKFIDVDDQLHKANSFYSPHSDVFATMCKPCDFPPQPYCSQPWREFMTFSGMISSVSQEIFIQFALALEVESKSGNNTKFKEKSDVLVKHLFQRKDLSDSSFLQRLKAIKFVRSTDWLQTPEKQELCQLSKPFCTDRLVSFSESCTGELCHLVWTSSCIISNTADPRQFRLKDEQQVLDELCLSITAPKHKVIPHVLSVCTVIAEETSKIEQCTNIKKVMIDLYRYLQEYVGDEDLVQFKTVPLIFDLENKRMLNPECTIFDLRKEEAVRKHIQKVPLELGEFKELFLRLGASECVTADHYAKVLLKLKQEAQGNILHVEELKIIQITVQNLFKCLKSNDANVKKLTVRSLHLPSEKQGLPGQFLEKSTELIFFDNPSIVHRLKIVPAEMLRFVDFKKLQIPDAELPLNVLKLLPDEHRMQLLSEVVQEIVPDHIKKLQTNGRLSQEAVNRLTSEDFAEVVFRIVYNEDKYNKSFNREKAEHIKLCLRSNITIVEISCLMTVLMWKDSAVVDTEKRKKAFVEKHDTGESSCTVYLDCELCKKLNTHQLDFCSVASVLRIAVTHVIGMDVKNAQLELGVQSPKQAMTQMDDEGYHPCDFAKPLAWVDTPLFPPPGTQVPLILHCYLINDLRKDISFEVGEHVGFEVYDPQVDDINTNENEPVYVYAIVKEEIQQGAETRFLAKQYLIDLGHDGQIVVSITQIYKFFRLPDQGTTLAVIKYNGRQQNDESLHEDTYSQQETEPENVHQDNPSQQQTENDTPRQSPTFQQQTGNERSQAHLRDFNTAMKEIRQQLTEAWATLDERGRKRVVKRLLLKWHPDKNMENKEFCTRVCQHMQQYVDLLNQGRPIPDEDENIETSTSASGRPQTSHDNDYSSFFDNMNRRGRAYNENFHREQAESNPRASASSSNASSGASYTTGESTFYSGRNRANDYTRFHYEYYRNESRANPQPGEARRWYLQAEADLEMARSCNGVSGNGYNWVCYECYQSAEKSLKAVLYNRDARNLFLSGKSIITLSREVRDDFLADLARQLETGLGNVRMMRYPGNQTGQRIPAELYKRQHANLAIQLASEILEKVKGILNAEHV